LAAVLTLASTSAQARPDRLRNVEPGEPLPRFQCDSLDGTQVGYDGKPGEVLLLVYLSAQQTQSERAMASAIAVAADVGSSALKLTFMTAETDQLAYFTQLRTELGTMAPLALDEAHQVYGRLGLIVFPTTVVSSRQGNLLHVVSGWTRDYEYRLSAFCRHALGEIDDRALAELLETSPQARDEARARADRHRAAAAILRSKGMFADAIRELESALTTDPSCTAAVLDLADLLVAQGQVDEAEKRLNALLAEHPDMQGSKLIKGLILLKRGELNPAERLLTEALATNPDRVRVHYYLGQLYEQKGDHKQAMEHYRDALKRSLKEE
jgi:predicted negative regulator of RcsB-dependent stress response